LGLKPFRLRRLKDSYVLKAHGFNRPAFGRLKPRLEMNNQNISDVRTVLQKFQDGYAARDLARLDEFMQLFVQDDSIEMIGIGAAKRAANEWFEGLARVREIIESDWRYWT